MFYFELISYSLLLFYFIFIIYLLIGIIKPGPKQSGLKEKASIIVPFRNEETNILRCLKSLTNQNTPKDNYEIIFINDDSADKTKEILIPYIDNCHTYLYDLSDSNNIISRKKLAVSLGISKSRYDIIVTTDADCWHDSDWLESILNSFTEKTGFVTGKIIYANCNTLFQKLQQIEFASLVGIGFSLIANKMPVLANGATCAYRKKLYHEVGGFKDNLHIASGDDEFLMQKIFFDTDFSVNYCSSEYGSAYTEPNKSVKDFINQRMRWSSKIIFYKNKYILFVLPFIYLFYFSVLLLFLSFFYEVKNILTFCMIFSFKIFADYILLRKYLFLLKIDFHLRHFLVAEILHFPYIILTPLLGIIAKYNWKGRKI